MFGVDSFLLCFRYAFDGNFCSLIVGNVMNESINGENPLFTCLTGSDCTFIPIPIVQLTSLAPVNFTCVELDGVLSSVAYSRRLDTWCGDSLLVCGTVRGSKLKSEDFSVQVKQLH